MKVGDLVRFVRNSTGGSPNRYLPSGIIGVIVDTHTHTETSRSAGCKKLVVLIEQGAMIKTWPGNLEVISESR